MISYLPLINISIAANFMLVLSYVINFIAFDIVPYIDDINDYLFTTRYSEGEITNGAVGFELLGFENHNYAKLTGSMWVFIFWMILSGFFFMIVRRFADNYFCV